MVKITSSLQRSPIVILHGWAMDEQNQLKWQPFTEFLEKEGWVVKFLPIPGLSSALDKVWQLNDFVNWVHQQVDGLPKVILVGHSFGGQLAVRFTSIFPEKVDRLILIDPSGIRPFTFKARLKRKVFGTAAQVGKVLFPLEIGRVVLHKLAREKDYLQASPTLRKTMQNVLADEIKADFPRITVPTCIIWGEDDTATPVSHAQLFSAGIANSQLHFVQGARHSPQFTHVEQTAKLVLSFLDQTSVEHYA
ncbi:alpha/beta hydrolase [Patescibacteria group bacterium]|nr:alpha/beta hydrolase [Patescibacteria group bacterium]